MVAKSISTRSQSLYDVSLYLVNSNAKLYATTNNSNNNNPNLPLGITTLIMVGAPLFYAVAASGARATSRPATISVLSAIAGTQPSQAHPSSHSPLHHRDVHSRATPPTQHKPRHRLANLFRLSIAKATSLPFVIQMAATSSSIPCTRNMISIPSKSFIVRARLSATRLQRRCVQQHVPSSTPLQGTLTIRE